MKPFEVSVHFVQSDQVNLDLSLAFLLRLFLLEEHLDFIERLCLLLLVDSDFLVAEDDHSEGRDGDFEFFDIVELGRNDFLVDFFVGRNEALTDSGRDHLQEGHQVVVESCLTVQDPQNLTHVVLKLVLPSLEGLIVLRVDLRRQNWQNLIGD
jgi:hypothetical protein